MNKLDTDSDMYRIVGCAFAVYNHLKPGYLESVYEEALYLTQAPILSSLLSCQPK